eukprot:SAG11_NODE_2346_length_3487_cov_1.474026_3_plen_213_part_00
MRALRLCRSVMLFTNLKLPPLPPQCAELQQLLKPLSHVTSPVPGCGAPEKTRRHGGDARRPAAECRRRKWHALEAGWEHTAPGQHRLTCFGGLVRRNAETHAAAEQAKHGAAARPRQGRSSRRCRECAAKDGGWRGTGGGEEASRGEHIGWRRQQGTQGGGRSLAKCWLWVAPAADWDARTARRPGAARHSSTPRPGLDPSFSRICACPAWL